jgi:hypothetical protein
MKNILRTLRIKGLNQLSKELFCTQNGVVNENGVVNDNKVVNEKI